MFLINRKKNLFTKTHLFIEDKPNQPENAFNYQLKQKEKTQPCVAFI